MTRVLFLAPLLLLLLPLAPVAAQKVPLPDASGRMLQLLDVRPLVVTGVESADQPADVTRRLQGLAEFARKFVDPPLTPQDDLQPLGGRYLAVLALPTQAAWIERLLTAAVRGSDRTVLVAVDLVELPKEAAAEQLLPRFEDPKATDRQPLRKALDTQEAATKVLADLKAAKDAATITAPRVVVRPLQPGHLSVGNQISYIRDFEIQLTAAGKIADPVVDTLFDGSRVQVAVAHLEKNQLAVQCAVLVQHVEKPIPEFKTNLGGGGAPISIQLPRCTAIRMEQTLIIPDGGGLLLAAPRGDGSWLCAVLQAHSVK